MHDLIGKADMLFGETRRRVALIAMPESWIVNVSFGGKDHQALFITASKGLYSIRMQHAGANAAK